MSPKDTIQLYFDALAQKGEWTSFLSDDLRFSSFGSPVKEVSGKAAYVESTKGFFSMITSLEVRDLVVEGAKACAFTRYQLRSPSGSTFHSDVAELFTVVDGKMESLGIYFDASPFPK